jgi:membrane fusion protein (multidrug efflux system)
MKMLFRRKNMILKIVIPIVGGIFTFQCSNSQAGGRYSMPPTPVETAVVTTRLVSDKFEAIGTIEAEKEITVVSEIDASVLSVPFKEGQKIVRGSLIAQLDTLQLAAELYRVSALLDQSRSNYERIKAVVEQAAGSQQDLDDAAAALKVAKANLQLAKARFAKTRIIAPFSGIIGARKISLAQIDELRVKFSAPERYLGKLRDQAEVMVSTTAYPGYILNGKIEVIEPVLDSNTRSAQVIAVVSNPDEKFRPGMSANITAILAQRPKALTIPNEAVFFNGDQSFVYQIKPDSTVSKVSLTLGTRLSDIVEVLKGLNDGDKIVRAGYQKLYDGARVQPIPSNAAADNS